MSLLGDWMVLGLVPAFAGVGDVVAPPEEVSDEEAALARFVSADAETLPRLLDIGYAYNELQARSTRFFPLVSYYRILTTPADPDDIHGELPDYLKKFSDPVLLRAFVRPDPETHPLTSFGLEQVRDVTLEVDIKSLVDAGLAEQNTTTWEVTLNCKIGDRFVFGKPVEYVYNILEIARGESFFSTDIPLYYLFKATRYRDEASEFSGIG